MAVNRVDRLNSEFRKNIYDILAHKVKNPNLTEMFSVTEVTCDSDLTLAKVYISIFSTNEEASKRTFEAIVKSGGFVRSVLKKSMHIHAIPQLVFVEDNRLENQDKISKILLGLNNDQTSDN